MGDVPLSYLAWLHDEAFPAEDLRAEIKLEIARRIGATMAECRALATVPDERTVAAAREVIRAGYRTLARKRHPDAGGSNAAMVATTQARGLLDALLSEAAA